VSAALSQDIGSARSDERHPRWYPQGDERPSLESVEAWMRGSGGKSRGPWLVTRGPVVGDWSASLARTGSASLGESVDSCFRGSDK